MGNALGGLGERKGYGSRMVYGGCWNFVGKLNQTTDRLSTPCFGVCKKPPDHWNLPTERQTIGQTRRAILVCSHCFTPGSPLITLAVYSAADFT